MTSLSRLIDRLLGPLARSADLAAPENGAIAEPGRWRDAEKRAKLAAPDDCRAQGAGAGIIDFSAARRARPPHPRGSSPARRRAAS